jgi:hypothetical protein
MNPEILADVRQALVTKKARHATFSKAPSVYEALINSKELMEYLYKTYFLDYHIWGYQLEMEVGID